MKLTLRVDVEGEYGHWAAAMDIPELYRREFKPLRICNDPMIAMATGEISKEAGKIVMKARKDAAEILAKELSDMIVSAMEQNDTYNGYAKN